MKLLIDTQILIWGAAGIAKVRPVVARALKDNDVYVSHVSVWEVAIKVSTGKLKVREDLVQWLPTTDLRPLPIELEHVWRVHDLPLLHRDPFDRLLVAQAMVEGMTLVTTDHKLAAYGLSILLN